MADNKEGKSMDLLATGESVLKSIQSGDLTAKALATIGICILASLIICFIWQKPKLDDEKAEKSENILSDRNISASQATSVTYTGNNSGTVAGFIINQNLPSADHEKSSNISLFAECRRSRIDKAPESGQLQFLVLAPDILKGLTGGLNQMNTTPGIDISSLNSVATDIYVCEVSNSGSQPAFNVYMYLHIVYNRRLENGGVDFNKNILSEIIYPITISKVDSNSQHPFQFFVLNQSHQPGYVDILPNIKFDSDVPNKKVEGFLRQPEPRYSRMLFLPS